MSDVILGFVGVGHMGQAAHLQNYLQVPGCRIAALAEPREHLGKAVARKYGIDSVYASAQEMLESEKLDGIVAIQPFDRHGQMLPSLYGAGLPLLTEKPLALSSAVGESLVRQLSATDAWHMVAYHKRCDPASAAAREKVMALRESGELGPLQYIRVTMPAGDWIQNGFNLLVSTDEAPPESSPDDDSPAAYVSFVNYYIHQVNLIRFLLDETFDVTYVSPGGLVLNGHSRSQVDVVLEMSPWTDSVGWAESALVCFERGWVKLDLPAPLAQYQAGRVTTHQATADGTSMEDAVMEFGPVHAMLAQAQRFVDAIKGEATPPSDAQDALLDLKIADQYLAQRQA